MGEGGVGSERGRAKGGEGEALLTTFSACSSLSIFHKSIKKLHGKFLVNICLGVNSL